MTRKTAGSNTVAANKPDDDPDGISVGEHLKSTYQHLGIDAIALIRLLAEDGLLDRILH